MAWLLGTPFFLQVIEGPGGAPTHLLGGLVETSAEGQRLHDAAWKIEVEQRADVVFAEVGGDPQRQEFADLARALLCASRVVQPEGRIILLGAGRPELGPGAQLLRQADTADEALALVKKQRPTDQVAAVEWATAASRATLYVLSRWPAELVEEIFAIPLENADQARRLLGQGTWLQLTDADRTLAVVRGQGRDSE